MKWSCNLGDLDRLTRLMVGSMLLVLTTMSEIGWWGLSGIIPLLTGLAGFCPVYILLRISTCGGYHAQRG